ncbi:hypothetical protein GCM10009111_29900 [Colwellia asteriadis]|uniref:Uncharacterized protein n=1 Tax=Colwellia asteriadis TaxID=517723 RepID=A0ABP3WP16_9GAMM
MSSHAKEALNVNLQAKLKQSNDDKNHRLALTYVQDNIVKYNKKIYYGGLLKWL